MKLQFNNSAKVICISAALACCMLACKPPAEKANLIDITSKLGQADQFKDLVLNITQTSETDSFFVYTASGLYQHDTVGLSVSLRKDLPAGIVNGEMKNVFVHNGIVLMSAGKPSDRLLSAMATLYDVDSVGSKMHSSPMILTAANLNQEPINYNTGTHKFKVFMETDSAYAELFVDFDFANQLIYLNEKDQEYRAGVLQFLSRP
jgi:hypothetical protein